MASKTYCSEKRKLTQAEIFTFWEKKALCFPDITKSFRILYIVLYYHYLVNNDTGPYKYNFVAFNFLSAL